MCCVTLRDGAGSTVAPSAWLPVQRRDRRPIGRRVRRNHGCSRITAPGSIKLAASARASSGWGFFVALMSAPAHCSESSPAARELPCLRNPVAQTAWDSRLTVACFISPIRSRNGFTRSTSTRPAGALRGNVSWLMRVLKRNARRSRGGRRGRGLVSAMERRLRDSLQQGRRRGTTRPLPGAPGNKLGFRWR